MSDKVLPEFKVGIRVSVPGTIFSVEAPEKIAMHVTEMACSGKDQYRMTLEAVQGVSTILIEGAGAEFRKLAALLDFVSSNLRQRKLKK